MRDFMRKYGIEKFKAVQETGNEVGKYLSLVG